MKAALTHYLAILHLADEPFAQIKQDPFGLRRALMLFLIVGLVASSAKWFNLNQELQQPTYAEQLETFTMQSANLGTQVEQLGNDLTGIMAWLFATPLETVATFLGRDVVEFGTRLGETAVQLEPPIGVRPSRVVALAGDWLGTPFSLLASWLLFAFVSLFVAKIAQGKAMLTQHLSLMALMIAPAFLLFFSYITPQSILISWALRPLSRLMTLIFILWSSLIGLKALIAAHDFSWQQAIGVLAVAALLLYIVLPVTLVLALAYLIV
ncbi:MAG: hypothetical protein AAF614_31850 [Chloroflexota bacterium]